MPTAPVGSPGTYANNAGITTFTVTMPQGTTAGNSLVLVVGYKDNKVSTVVSTSGTWARVADTNTPAGISQQTEIWLLSGVAAGITAVDVTATGNGRVVAHCMEWTGALTADTGVAAIGSANNAPSPGAVTPTQATGVLYAATQYASTSTTPSTRPTGFTAATSGNVESAAASGSGTELDVVYKIDHGTSAVTPTWGLSASVNWGAAAVMLKETSSVTLTTVRPSSTIAAGGWTTGAASLHAALSDQSDATTITGGT